MAARHKRPRPAKAEERRRPSGDSLPVEEELLASYLAGTLGDEQRREVARYLASNPDAREVLSMASSAMNAEKRTK